MDRLAAMETFVRVVDTGSFSAAAPRLRMGQPAVSKAMAQLEDRLGVRLLLRSSRGLATTEAGQNFYERAKRAIEEADEADLAEEGHRWQADQPAHLSGASFRDAPFVPRSTGPSLLVVEASASYSRQTGQLKGFRRGTERARRSGQGRTP
jgi:DNA-binding transcriptional LysR family regulator